MKYISRHIEEQILKLSQSYSAILLTGPRQAGKTTMLRSLAQKENIGREYVTLDDLTVRDMAKNDPALFLQLHKPPVLIDEVNMLRSCLPISKSISMNITIPAISG